jgi:hypothetical protein
MHVGCSFSVTAPHTKTASVPSGNESRL